MKQSASMECGTVCGTATVGPRGQIVIPKDARDKLNLKPGSRFLVIEHSGKIILAPEELMRSFLQQMSTHLY